jgi:hypothetical protein
MKYLSTDRWILNTSFLSMVNLSLSLSHSFDSVPSAPIGCPVAATRFATRGRFLDREQPKLIQFRPLVCDLLARFLHQLVTVLVDCNVHGPVSEETIVQRGQGVDRRRIWPTFEYANMLMKWVLFFLVYHSLLRFFVRVPLHDSSSESSLPAFVPDYYLSGRERPPSVGFSVSRRLISSRRGRGSDYLRVYAPVCVYECVSVCELARSEKFRVKAKALECVMGFATHLYPKSYTHVTSPTGSD